MLHDKVVFCKSQPYGMQRHATVMGSTWGLLIPAAILMARLRNKKGWWFQLHRALAIASLFLVVVGAILGRRLRVTHPPVTIAGKVHKLLGYTALTFICLQVGHTSLCSFYPCILPASALHLLHEYIIILCPHIIHSPIYPYHECAKCQVF